MSILSHVIHHDEDWQSEYNFYSYEAVDGLVQYLLEEDYVVSFNSSSLKKMRLVSLDGSNEVTVTWVVR